MPPSKAMVARQRRLAKSGKHHRRKQRAVAPISGVRTLYRKCLALRGQLEREAVVQYREEHGLRKERLEEPDMLAACRDVPSFFALAERESSGWYKRPLWASERYGAK